ncbi:hypothetical protein NU118_003349 [Salmonella enterica]|nr:hypothetical protein [Salmonella enterica]EIG0992151.1 hypothetical protein [Salmonella enterica]EIX9960503.1 hypothetical protein [Salmonella enterica]EJP2998852.1 hypothetical protein [Salmonella enterica]EKI4847636.1 hypothetical protein [Salmonella enterica]
MTKHQRMLLTGASHCLWCGVVLGLLAADMYPGAVPAFSGVVLRGLAVASFISVLLWIMVSYREDISWTYIWTAMLLPPLTTLLLCHVVWLGYSFNFWQWDYDFSLFIREAVLPVVFFIWGASSFLIVPFIFLFILSPGGVE